MFIPDPSSHFFYHRSRLQGLQVSGFRIRIREFKYFQPKKIQDVLPRTCLQVSGFRIRIREFKYFQPKKIQDVLPRTCLWIFFPSRIPYPDQRDQKSTRYRIRNTAPGKYHIEFSQGTGTGIAARVGSTGFQQGVPEPTFSQNTHHR